MYGPKYKKLVKKNKNKKKIQKNVFSCFFSVFSHSVFLVFFAFFFKKNKKLVGQVCKIKKNLFLKKKLYLGAYIFGFLHIFLGKKNAFF